VGFIRCYFLVNLAHEKDRFWVLNLNALKVSELQSAIWSRSFSVVVRAGEVTLGFGGGQRIHAPDP
jgi:hypothetical protein